MRNSENCSPSSKHQMPTVYLMRKEYFTTKSVDQQERVKKKQPKNEKEQFQVIVQCNTPPTSSHKCSTIDGRTMNKRYLIIIIIVILLSICMSKTG